MKNDFAHVDVKTKDTDKESVEEKIKEQSQNAIGSLSEEELEVNLHYNTDFIYIKA